MKNPKFKTATYIACFLFLAYNSSASDSQASNCNEVLDEVLIALPKKPLLESSPMVEAPSAESATSELKGTKKPKIKDLIWEDHRMPLQSLWDNLYIDPPRHPEIPNGKIAKLVTYEDLLELSESKKSFSYVDDELFFNHPTHGKFKIYKTGKNEATLLELSSLSSTPREALEIRIITKSGPVAVLGPISGERNSVSTVWQTIAGKLDNAIKALREKKVEILRIEHIHTHPFPAFVVRDFPKVGRLFGMLHEFSDVDIDAYRTISRYFPNIPVEGRVITPNGFGYTMTFKEGKPR